MRPQVGAMMATPFDPACHILHRAWPLCTCTLIYEGFRRSVLLANTCSNPYFEKPSSVLGASHGCAS